ncbi:hypothetical protein EDB84DRAFT_1567396 [Lactarius hengduanensis]|nr:hypothetical protein EDB84DRAFT_1567396 [Lactarius hengduanensis]
MDIDTISVGCRYPPKTPAHLELKARCQREGRCFKCLQMGHLAQECPGAPGKPTVTPTVYINEIATAPVLTPLATATLTMSELSRYDQQNLIATALLKGDIDNDGKEIDRLPQINAIYTAPVRRPLLPPPPSSPCPLPQPSAPASPIACFRDADDNEDIINLTGTDLEEWNIVPDVSAQHLEPPPIPYATRPVSPAPVVLPYLAAAIRDANTCEMPTVTDEGKQSLRDALTVADHLRSNTQHQRYDILGRPNPHTSSAFTAVPANKLRLPTRHIAKYDRIYNIDCGQSSVVWGICHDHVTHQHFSFSDSFSDPDSDVASDL